MTCLASGVNVRLQVHDSIPVFHQGFQELEVADIGIGRRHPALSDPEMNLDLKLCEAHASIKGSEIFKGHIL